jgi:hypothetical protein
LADAAALLGDVGFLTRGKAAPGQLRFSKPNIDAVLLLTVQKPQQMIRKF